MSDAEVFGLALLLVAGVPLWWWFLTFERRDTKRLVAAGRDGATFRVAGAGSMFVPCFDPHVVAGSTIYLPSGDGLYPGRDGKAKRYVAGLTRWLERGATIHLVIAQPSGEARHRWHELCEAHRQRLHVYFLDADGPPPEVGSDLADLLEGIATRHPVILVNPTGAEHPGAMWIELFHPVGSRFAYDVRFVPPGSVGGSTVRQEFRRYVAAYSELLASPLVTEVLSPEAMAPVQQREAA